jgi:CRP-like cAMP-binding protein
MLQASVGRDTPSAAPSFDLARSPLLEASGSNIRVPRDRALFWEGDEASQCYRIIAGAVRICKVMADGRRQVSDFLLPGDLIGFDLNFTHRSTAEAIVDCVVRVYPKPQLERIVDESPRMARQMLHLAYDRLSLAQHQMVTLARKTAMERLASFLLTLGRRQAPPGKPSQPVALPMSRIDIADHLGLTVETVSRLFSKLKRDRVIGVPDTHSIIVLDWQTLDDLSEAAEA